MAKQLPIYPGDFKCEICGNDPEFEWWYRHGQARCVHCGATYQLYDKGWIYPVIDIAGDWIPVCKAWWESEGDKEPHDRLRLEHWLDINRTIKRPV